MSGLGLKVVVALPVLQHFMFWTRFKQGYIWEGANVDDLLCSMLVHIWRGEHVYFAMAYTSSLCCL